MNYRITLIVVVILAFLVIGCSSAPYAGPDAEVTYSEYRVSITVDYHYGIIRGNEINPSNYYAGCGRKFITALGIEGNELRIAADSRGNYISFNIETVNKLYPQFKLQFNRRKQPYTVYLSVHPKDPAKPRKDLYFRLDRIEGLMSLEEAQAIIAQQEAEKAYEAEKAAQAEAQRLAREEANRYDPSKFIIVPSDFKPADYTKADLFAAVAASERLEIVASGWFNQTYTPSLKYVSDVVFVSQDGTDITFRTADNAISRRMKVSSRTGLTAGQRVRIYYSATRLANEWRVHAIERL